MINDDCAAGEDEDEEMKMAALLQRRNHLAGYCKLIIYGVLELRAATDILKYYNKVCGCGCVWVCVGVFITYETHSDSAVKQLYRR